MANYNGVNAAIAAASPPSNEVDNAYAGAKERVIIDSIDYAAQAAGSTFTLGTSVPAGAVITSLQINTDTSTGSTTLEFGDGTTAGKFAAAAAYTTTDTWTELLIESNVMSKSAAAFQLTVTTAAATAPASGTLYVIIRFSTDN